MYVSQPETKKIKTGRPEDEEKREAFVKVVDFLRENDDEQITVSDLMENIKEFLGGEGAYGRTHMRTKLKEYLGKEVIITNINGKPNVVTFVTTANHILQDFHCSQECKRTKPSTLLKLLRN